MSYGGDFSQSHRQAGRQAGRILKGEKASELPVQRVTKVELFINLKAAADLGITVPLATDQRRPGHRMTARRMTTGAGPRRTSLFRKYFATLFAAVAAPLLIAGGSEAWLGYRDERARLNDILNAEARLAAVKIDDFLDGIREQLGWTVQLPWSEESGERHRLDALGLLRQVPAVESLTLVDAAGRERLFVSRIGLNRIDSRADLSLRPAVQGARANGVVVRAGEVPGRLGAFHDDRGRRQSLVGRRGDRRGQPQAHLGGDLRDQGGAHRRRLRPRRPGAPDRPSRHQPGAARRRGGTATVPGPARRHPRPARRGCDRPRRRGRDGAGGDGADPERRLERHRQAAAGRGLRAALRGAVAHRGAAGGRRPVGAPGWRGGWPSA